MVRLPSYYEDLTSREEKIKFLKETLRNPNVDFHTKEMVKRVLREAGIPTSGERMYKHHQKRDEALSNAKMKGITIICGSVLLFILITFGVVWGIAALKLKGDTSATLIQESKPPTIEKKVDDESGMQRL